MSNSLSEKDENYLVISFMKEKDDVDAMGSPGVMTLIASADNTHQEFCRLFAQSVTDSSYQKFGGKVTRRKNSFKLEDFVLILLANGVKYGIVNELISKHTIRVKFLNKNKRTKVTTRSQSFSVETSTFDQFTENKAKN